MFAYYLIVKHDKALLQLSEILRHCQMMIESHVFTQNLHTKALKTTRCTSSSQQTLFDKFSPWELTRKQ